MGSHVGATPVKSRSTQSQHPCILIGAWDSKSPTFCSSATVVFFIIFYPLPFLTIPFSHIPQNMKPILPAPSSTPVSTTDHAIFIDDIDLLSNGADTFNHPHHPFTSSNQQQDMDIHQQPQLDLDAFATIATTISPLPIISTARRASLHNNKASKLGATSGDYNGQTPLTSSSSSSSSSSTSSTTRSTTKSPRKRNNHNECERKRRDSIRLSFANLQARLPHFFSLNGIYNGSGRDIKKHNTGEMSKMQVLNGAIERIKKLKESIVRVNGEVDKLRKQVAEGQRNFMVRVECQRIMLVSLNNHHPRE